MPLTLDPSTIL